MREKSFLANASTYASAAPKSCARRSAYVPVGVERAACFVIRWSSCCRSDSWFCPGSGSSVRRGAGPGTCRPAHWQCTIRGTMTATAAPATTSAAIISIRSPIAPEAEPRVTVLVPGYVGYDKYHPELGQRAAESTATLIQVAGRTIVVDPGQEDEPLRNGLLAAGV